jgi:hypothetical protein
VAGPDDYADQRQAAWRELEGKNARIYGDFRLSHWPRYDYDLEAGTLTFSDATGPKVVATIQVAGSVSVQAGDWMWAWANPHWPQGVCEDALATRRHGEEHGIVELVEQRAQAADIMHLAWELTAVAVHLTGAVGAYRAPDANTPLFLLIKDIAFAN